MARTASETASTGNKRPRKTAAEKAQADYDAAVKAYDKAVQRRDKVNEQIEAANTEVTETKRYLDFVKMNPALPPQAGENEAAPEAEGTNAAE